MRINIIDIFLWYTSKVKHLIRYLGIKLTKEVNDLYSENYTTLKKEIKEHTSKWKHIPSSWIRRIKSLKYPYYPKQSIDSMQSLSKY